MTLFTLASALCGLAHDENVLIAARFLQGLGGAVSSSVIIAMIVTEFPEPGRARQGHERLHLRRRRRRLDRPARRRPRHAAVNWHWIFFINIPIGVVTLLLGPRAARRERGHRARQGRRRARLGHRDGRADARHLRDRRRRPTTAGAPRTRSLFGGAVARCCWRLLRARRPASRTRSCRCASCACPGLASTSVVRGLLATGLFSTFFLGALYLERVRGYSALRTGVAFLPLSLAVGVLSAGITARLMGRFGARRVMLPGLVLTAVGLLLMARRRRALELFPDACSSRCLILGLGAGTGVHPAARDRDGPRAERRRRPRLGHRQRLAADVRRDRPGRPGTISTDHARSLVADGHAPAERAHRRLPAGVPRGRGLRRRWARSWRSCCCARRRPCRPAAEPAPGARASPTLTV